LDATDQIYVKLQQHLDRQAIGFPASRSGAELKVLRHIFTPAEAEVATCLSYRPEPLEKVYSRARHLVASSEELAEILDAILKKGGIEVQRENGHLRYCNSPLVVGMYELQTSRLTSAFIEDFKEYTSDKRFGIAFLSTELPQMRTIPIARSIRPQHQAATFDEVTQLLSHARGPFVVVPCICRQKKQIAGEPCCLTTRRETCLAIGSIAETVLLSGQGREIERAEALAIIEANQNDGLILQPSNTAQAAFICSCCGCCCGMLQMHHSLPRPVDFWASNYFARVDAARCNGCGICTRRCQVRAMTVPGKQQTARVDLNRCLGCGHCIAACPQDALALEKKPAEVRPPETREALFEILKANRKGPIGKARLAGKLVLDMLRTGNIDLLR
jgi:electron transport complex protein RnfB